MVFYEKQIIRVPLHPVKIFAFIMAIVILVVSCAPCKDGSSVMKPEKSHASLVQEHTHDQDGDSDDCSPLCTCSCCSAHSYPPSFVFATGVIAETSITHSSFYNGSLISVSLPIWQPPQLQA